MELTLKRIDETPNSTLGVLRHESKWLGFVIEDGYRAVKEYGLTRIPAGRYKIERRKSGKFYEKYSNQFKHKWVPQLMNVPGFDAILIHAGNTVGDTKGCLLPCGVASFDPVSGNYFGGNSVACYCALYEYLDKVVEDIFITAG